MKPFSFHVPRAPFLNNSYSERSGALFLETLSLKTTYNFSQEGMRGKKELSNGVNCRVCIRLFEMGVTSRWQAICHHSPKMADDISSRQCSDSLMTRLWFKSGSNFPMLSVNGVSRYGLLT